MNKQEILDYFNDINHVYNEAGRLDSLSYMIDELLEDIKAEITYKYIDCIGGTSLVAKGCLKIIDKHIGKAGK